MFIGCGCQITACRCLYLLGVDGCVFTGHGCVLAGCGCLLTGSGCVVNGCGCVD